MKKLLGILVLSLLWSNVGFADAASVKKACRDLGFELGTELFLDCAIKLMSQENQSGQNITLKPDDDDKESFNEKYKSLADFLPKKKDKNKEDSSKIDTFNKKYKTLEDLLKKN